MQRWLSRLFITAYLLVLTYGLVCHTLGYRVLDHIGMYFIVWDMYSGWCGFEERHHILAEGESGRYYQLTPPPWGELTPFGDAGRVHYDTHARFVPQIALNVLRRTEHEPIRRIYLVDESWSKKYNLADSFWSRRYDQPKSSRSYYYLRAAYGPQGETLVQHCDWRVHLAMHCVADNPRLQEQIARSQPYSTAEALTGSAQSVQPAAYFAPAR